MSNKKESKLEKMAKKELNKKNPGKENKEKRKSQRGETFVGNRPTVMKSGKDKSNSRQSIKNETRKRTIEYDDER